MNHLPVGLKCYMIRPGYKVLDGITLQEGGVFNLAANEWSGARTALHPQHLLRYYNHYVAEIQDAAIYNPLQFIFVSPTVGPLWKGERLDLRTLLDQGLTPEQLGKIGTIELASIVATTAAAEPLDCLPVNLRCYMRRPGHGMLQEITLQKGGLFNVEANEWSEAREGIYPRHLLHYYNRYVAQIHDAAIYDPFEFIFVADGGFCEYESLRDILERGWTPEQLATVGEGVAEVHRAATVAAATAFAHNSYSSIQPIQLDVAAVMARLDAEVVKEDEKVVVVEPPAAAAAAAAAATAVAEAAAAGAIIVETFCTSKGGKRLLDSCGGFEELRPRVCELLDPDCVQTNILSLDGDIHWVKVTPKGAALWDELRAIQRHMKALRELCK